jgi:hypothetical protein
MDSIPGAFGTRDVVSLVLPPDRDGPLKEMFGQRSVSDVERLIDSRPRNYPGAERSYGGGPCRSFDHAGLARRGRIGIEAAGNGTTYDSAGKSAH